jgi:hypothetical protein
MDWFEPLPFEVAADSSPPFSTLSRVGALTLDDWQDQVCEWAQNGSLLGKLVISVSPPDRSDRAVPFTIGLSGRIAEGLASLTRSPTFPCLPCRERSELVSSSLRPETDRSRRGSGGHATRSSIVAHLRASLGVQNRYPLGAEEYLVSLGMSKFVVSPEGNGIDCHRHYEAILMGAVPIMEDSSLMRYKYRGCPVLFTSRAYQDITPSFLNAAYEEMRTRTYDFSAMFHASYRPELHMNIVAHSRFYMDSILGVASAAAFWREHELYAPWEEEEEEGGEGVQPEGGVQPETSVVPGAVYELAGQIAEPGPLEP